MLALDIAILSEPGGRPTNEDACGHWSSGRELCCVMADGAGGHGGGSTASRLAVETLLRSFAQQPTTNGTELAALLRGANSVIHAARVPNTELEQMYSTVVCLVIDCVGHRAHWAHAGDSRLYRFRDRRIVEQTRDHSLVQSMLDAGLLQASQVRGHPQRSELRSALGADDTELELSDSGEPRDVLVGDVFLLCTDGVWECVDEPALESTLAAAATPDQWLGDLGRAVVAAAGAQRPRHDNFSALAAWVAAARDE